MKDQIEWVNQADTVVLIYLVWTEQFVKLTGVVVVAMDVAWALDGFTSFIVTWDLTWSNYKKSTIQMTIHTDQVYVLVVYVCSLVSLYAYRFGIKFGKPRIYPKPIARSHSISFSMCTNSKLQLLKEDVSHRLKKGISWVSRNGFYWQTLVEYNSVGMRAQWSFTWAHQRHYYFGNWPLKDVTYSTVGVGEWSIYYLISFSNRDFVWVCVWLFVNALCFKLTYKLHTWWFSHSRLK